MVKVKVRVGKIDLDTCGAAYLLGVTRKDEVVALRGDADPSDLNDQRIICIEVGGSGQTWLNNFDHHGAEVPQASAAWQVFSQEYCRRCSWVDDCPGWLWSHQGTRCPGDSHRLLVLRLVEYINLLDTEGPKALGPKSEELFPTLSDVFSGMLLSERNPVEQLHLGVEILQEVVRQGIDPYGRMPIEDVPERAAYAKAKADNNRQMAKAVEQAQWETTSSGFKLAFLETDFFGAPGALYGVGAQVVVAFSPHFGPAGVPKFTIAGNGIKVGSVLPRLNALESGWGGPPTGTIVGSPREGSTLELSQVVAIVKGVL